jgi:hypothetical protein
MERALDFWVGEWDGRWEGGSGTNVISAAHDGTVILERFDGRPGTALRGISVSFVWLWQRRGPKREGPDREVPDPAWTDQWRIDYRRKR